jgi:sugar lactone lactonase YvrE
LNDPWGIAIDGAGNLFIADLENNRVRRVDAASQIITTVAGGGSSTEQNILATAASIYPIGVVIDNAGNLFILDYPVSVRRVDAATRKIVTIAGVGAEWVVFAGDNGPALQAVFNYPRGIALDSSGNLFIADTGNHRIRAVRGPFN